MICGNAHGPVAWLLDGLCHSFTDSQPLNRAIARLPAPDAREIAEIRGDEGKFHFFNRKPGPTLSRRECRITDAEPFAMAELANVYGLTISQ